VTPSSLHRSLRIAACASFVLGCASDSTRGDAEAGAGFASGTGGNAGHAGVGAASGMGGGSGIAGGAGQGGGSGEVGGSGDAGGGQSGSPGGGVRDAAREEAEGGNDGGVALQDGDATSSGERTADGPDARADVTVPPSDGPTDCTPFPTAGLYATFHVVNDVFYASITNPSGIDQALALWLGQSQANIPVGQLECGNGTYNCGWRWRMNPASITFAELTIEVCDATPSYVENNCPSFPSAQYCPWSAKLVQLRDCRTNVSCPPVPR
jgi:hypothetical protein